MSVRCLLLGLLLPALPAPLAGGETATPRPALMVFVSYQGARPLAVEASSMRLTGSRALAEALESRGLAVVAYPDLLPVMQRWRIRSDGDLSRGFLDDLASRFPVECLMVVRLDVYPDRLVALARIVSVKTGCLTAADVVEEPCRALWENDDAARANWSEAVGGIGRALARDWRAKEPGTQARSLVVLPMKAVGVGWGHADVGATCLIRALLDSGAWALPDPALVRSSLLDAGHGPRPLTAESRQVLRERFEADAVLVPELISFGRRQGTRVPEFADDAGEGPGTPYQLETRIPVLLTVLLVDSASGMVREGRAAYLEPENPAGLFGIVRDIRASARLRKGAHRLVDRMVPEKGEES